MISKGDGHETDSTLVGDVLVEARNLVKEFPVGTGARLRRRSKVVHAVSNITFSVLTGETFGIVGESGCGKTTVSRLIVALDTPTSGEVLLQGESLTAMSAAERRRHRRDLQMVFQDPYASLDPRMRVGAIIEEPLDVQDEGTRKERQARVRELLSEVGLPGESADRYPHEFSGGQRQRIGLARALALNPKLIVADEPVSALDVSIRGQILNLLVRLQQRYRLTYVVISHDLSVIRYVASRIGVMYLGKLVEVGSTQAIYEHAAHPYTQGLLDSVPFPNPRLARDRKRATPKGELPSPTAPPSGCRYRTRCPLAQAVCASEEPPLRRTTSGQLVACHFPLQSTV